MEGKEGKRKGKSGESGKVKNWEVNEGNGGRG